MYHFAASGVPHVVDGRMLVRVWLAAMLGRRTVDLTVTRCLQDVRACTREQREHVVEYAYVPDEDPEEFS